MRISEIKNLTDNLTLRGVFKFFWNYPIEETSARSVFVFRDVLSLMEPVEKPDDVFRCITDVFFSKQEIQTEKTIVRNLKRASKILYGDPLAFADGTPWGEEKRAHAAQNAERKRIREQMYLDLSFLYEVLGAKKYDKREEWRDLIFWLARSEMGPLILENKDKIMDNKFFLYNIACDYYLPKIGTDAANFPEQRIMGMISVLLFGDRNYWLTVNQIDRSMLILPVKKEKIEAEEPEKKTEMPTGTTE